MPENMTFDRIEEKIGKASPMVHAKTIDHLDPGALSWLAASTTMIASSNARGHVDIVLGGGAPGWAAGATALLDLPADALDDPDRLRAGNGFGSVFLVPGLREVLRINGRVMSSDAAVTRVAVEECYFHCGKALIRSDFWTEPTHDPIGATIADFAARCRFLGLGTADGDGHADLSPKGDPAGQTARVDGNSLCFADRPGNRRIDSFRNIIAQPHVAAALLVPGSADVVIARGTARIGDDIDWRRVFTVNDKTPELVTLIAATSIERYTSAALERAAPWRAAPAPPDVSPGKIAAGHLKLATGLASRLAGAVMSVPGLVERELDKDYRKNLY